MKATLTMIIGVLLVTFLFACQEELLSDSKVKNIVNEKLAEAISGKGVDISKLPPPKIERQGDNLIYEFKDQKQNAWIVLIVHPDGFAEISFDTIK